MKTINKQKKLNECICNDFDGKGKSACGIPCPIHCQPEQKKSPEWEEYIKGYIDFKTIEDRDVCLNWIKHLLGEQKSEELQTTNVYRDEKGELHSISYAIKASQQKLIKEIKKMKILGGDSVYAPLGQNIHNEVLDQVLELIKTYA